MTESLTAMTEVADWQRYTGYGTVRDFVIERRGGLVDEHDVAGIILGVRERINLALEGTGIWMRGDRFYASCWPVPRDAAGRIMAAIDSVNVTDIAACYQDDDGFGDDWSPLRGVVRIVLVTFAVIAVGAGLGIRLRPLIKS